MKLQPSAIKSDGNSRKDNKYEKT